MEFTITDTELKHLTTELLEKFPLELREMVYDEVLTPDQTALLDEGAFLDEEDLEYFEVPRFVDVSLVHLEFARELVLRYCTHHFCKNLVLGAFDNIDTCFKTDIFGLGVTPAQATLSRVALNEDLGEDSWGEDDIEKIQKKFAPLLEESPKFAPGFRFHVSMGADMDSSSYGGFEESVFVFVRALRPIVKKIQAKCPKDKDGRAKISIRIDCAGGNDYNVLKYLGKGRTFWNSRTYYLLRQNDRDVDYPLSDDWYDD